MKHSSHGCMKNHHDDSMEHDIHSVLQPAHDAFNELLKDRIKSKLEKNPAVIKQIEELSDMGFSLISEHLEEIIEDVKKSLEDNKDAHHS